MNWQRKLWTMISYVSMASLMLLLVADTSLAIPSFARKYAADCSTCHTLVPRLNRYGYEFRAAGYRDPDDIGTADKDFDLGNFFAARLQEQYKYNSHNPASGETTSTSSLDFKEFTMYPLTGSWGKYFGSLAEISMAPDEGNEIENAYVRGVYPVGKSWIQARVGIAHSFEGFGASDRPLGTMRTLFQTSNAVGAPFKLWSKDEAGAQIGFYSPTTGTSISADVWNGINAAGESAQGGGLSKDSSDKDFQVFVNQFINDDSAISLYFYNGTVPFPDADNRTRDDFQRYAAYANFYVIDETLNLIAGYEFGHDSLSNSSVAGGSSVGDSNGYFAGVEYFAIPDTLALAVRYDAFDPSDKISNNDVSAIVVSCNFYYNYGLQLIADYRHKEADQTSGGSNNDDTLSLRLISIW